MKKNAKKQIRYIQNILLPDKLAILHKFKKYMGHFPDLKNPKTFNEKMQWLKLNDRSSMHTIAADKYLARNFISEIIGEEYLIPLEFQTYNSCDITSENLPDFPCIIKTNHDCGGTLIVQDKSKVNWSDTQHFFQKRLQKNYFYYGREPQYKYIKSRIIIEKLLLDKTGNIPYDYKVYCFNGKAKMIAVDKDRGKPTKSRNWYDINWKKENIFWNTGGDDSIIAKPESFNSLIDLSEKIAEKFIFVRVDWFELEGKLFIGELTHHPGSGFVKFEPEKWDRVLGDFLKLPK